MLSQTGGEAPLVPTDLQGDPRGYTGAFDKLAFFTKNPEQETVIQTGPMGTDPSPCETKSESSRHWYPSEAQACRNGTWNRYLCWGLKSGGAPSLHPTRTGRCESCPIDDPKHATIVENYAFR